MALQFGVFDHIEPILGQDLYQIYSDRLSQIERFDAEGFYAYHLAEHHTPAVHSLAPSQNVFLAAASQRTERIRLNPCIYVLPLHHPLRLIEEICMLDHLSDGRLEVGVGRGGLLEAYFWGSDWDVERNLAKYSETLNVVRAGLSPNPPMDRDGRREDSGRGEGVTGAMIRARIWVDGRLACGLQALLGAPMAAYSVCGERDGGIGHGKRRSRTGLARVCGDVGLAGGSVADGRRQAGSGMARSRASARLNCSSHARSIGVPSG